MSNYFPYSQNGLNHYILSSNNSTNYFQYQFANVNEQKRQNKNKSAFYNFYNNNINNVNININELNSEPNKINKGSLQEQILSPTIEDTRPKFPIPIYHDDTQYNNFVNFNRNYNLKYYQNANNKNYIYNNERNVAININSSKYNNINYNKKMLILDLDETLVHSCFKPNNIINNNTNNNLAQPDILLKIQFHSKYHDVFVYKRPFVDEFLEKMDQYYNLIIFTASVQEYADPLLNVLDKNRLIKLRFYRNSCVLDKNGKFIKNLSNIFADLKNVILLDNNPISYSYNKTNGLPILTWHFDKKDRELLKLIPILEFTSNVNDVRNFIPRFVEFDMVSFSKFNMLLDEINKQKEQNNIQKIRPKSSKHMQVSKQEFQNNLYNNNPNFNNDKKIEKEKEIKNRDNNNERNINHISIKQEKKFSTINNISVQQNKEIKNINKNLALKKNELDKKNKSNEKISNNNADKHKNRRINNLFKNKNNKYKDKKNKKINPLISEENRSIDYFQKESKIDRLLDSKNYKFIIINNNQDKKGNEYKDNKNEKYYGKNIPFIMKTAEQKDKKKFSLFYEYNKDKKENNNDKSIQINIINNIQKINLFKNEFKIEDNNIKKIDIINYYKNNSRINSKEENKKEKMNNSYSVREEKNKDIQRKRENKTRNQSYTNIKGMNNFDNKIKNNENDNIRKYYHNTTNNFYSPNNKNINKDNIINNSNKELQFKNDLINDSRNNKNKSANIKYEKMNNQNNNIDMNKYNIFNNNYSFNENKNINNNINLNNNKNERLIQISNYNNENNSYRPWSVNKYGNSNYNDFYYNYNSNYRYDNINNIRSYFFPNNYNNKNILQN